MNTLFVRGGSGLENSFFIDNIEIPNVNHFPEQGYDDLWRNRVFDNRYMFNMEGGYKPNNEWEFSFRWIWAGGAPYTLFDIPASEAAHHGVYDAGRINSARRPDYHSLNLRFDRIFSSLLFVYSAVLD